MSKHYIRLKQNRGFWDSQEYNSYLLRVFVFIFQESSDFLNSLIGYMSDPQYTGFGGNAANVSFKNNYVKIMWFYDDDPDENAFVVEKDLLIKIIRAWQQLVKQAPKEITICQEGDTFILEGVLGDGEKVTHIVE